MLHGHQHNHKEYNTKNKQNGILRYDVGVDANDMAPVSAEEIIEFWFGKWWTIDRIACNILRIGVLVYPAYLKAFNIFLSIVVFAVFQIFIFGRLVQKHTTRIINYKQEYQFF